METLRKEIVDFIRRDARRIGKVNCLVRLMHNSPTNYRVIADVFESDKEFEAAYEGTLELAQSKAPNENVKEWYPKAEYKYQAQKAYEKCWHDCRFGTLKVLEDDEEGN